MFASNISDVTNLEILCESTRPILQNLKEQLPEDVNFLFERQGVTYHFVKGRVYISEGSKTQVFFYSDYRG